MTTIEDVMAQADGCAIPTPLRAAIECSRCGKQWTVPCSFDEDYS